MELQINLKDFRTDINKKLDFMKYFYDKQSSATLNWGLQVILLI